jgi:preprotein translocase subunit SecB
MNNVNINKDDSIKLLKYFIKDLSFENPQNIEENNVFQISNSDLNINMNVFYRPYNNNNFFSLLLRFNLECFSEENKRNLFNLELDYFGFFEILKQKNYDQKELTESGTKVLFPFVKEIVEDITRRGGSFPVSLNEVDFNLVKN